VAGKGDILTPTPKFIENLWLYIFYPGFEVSTADAYSSVTPVAGRDSLIDILFSNISSWKENLVNDFESQVFKKFPVIAEIKQKVYESGALYSSMSGSGSSIFGLYSEKPSLSEDLCKLLVWEEMVSP
jgi:4-diphosphocytidyl-2-C-methyl-D-erythritol kinase